MHPKSFRPKKIIYCSRMDNLETVHTFTVGNRCFGQIYDDLGVQELLELEVQSVDSIVPRTTERLLLKLTTIHRLFQLFLSGRKTCGKLNDICYYLISNDITRKVVSCLEDTNQHVVFIASKAISSLMLSVPLIYTTNIQLGGLFQDFNGSEWKSLYVMNILKQVIEGRAGDRVHNMRVHSQSSSVCHCTSGEPRVFDNEEKSNIELLEFIVTQEWMSILPLYVPLWEEIFMDWIEDVMAENPNCTPMDLSGYHSKLACSIHQRMNDDCFEICVRSEQVFVSFLSFLTEFLNWTLKICHNMDPTDVIGGRIFEKLESHNKMLLLNIIQVVPHFLHVKELSSYLWKEILQLLSFSLSTNTQTQNSHHYQHQALTDQHILHLATSFICTVNCCILENIPLQARFEGFGGSTVKPFKENLTQTCESRGPNTGVFRQASLLVVQAALILLNSCKNYRNAQFSQDIFKAINIWYGSLIKVGTSNSDNQDAYQKGLGNLNNQEAEPSMILMNVFADQDDEMIQMMLLLLQLFKVSREPAYQDVAVTLGTLNPHLVFQAFLKVIGFDHSVLLDFLISSETAVFLEYLIQYMRFVLQDWQGFSQRGNDSFEDTITTNDDETEIKHTVKVSRQSYRGNDKTTMNPSDNKPASSSVGMMACKQANSGDISSRSSPVGLGGLSNICVAYGSDTEDDDDSGDDGDDEEEEEEDENENEIRRSNSDGIGCAETIDIHDNFDTKESISDYDNANRIHMPSAFKAEKNNGFDTDMDRCCDDDRNHSNESENYDVDDSASKNENKQDDNDIYMGINYTEDINHGDDKQRTSLAHEMVSDDDIHDDERDIDGDDESATTGRISTMLEMTMSTLIHTRIATERLNEGSLFPYQVKPLINVIKKVENLYDGC